MRLTWEITRGLRDLWSQCRTPLDRAVHLVLLATYKPNMLPHSGLSNTRHLSMAAVAQLSTCDLDDLQQRAPGVLVWIALSMGPSAAATDVPFLEGTLLTAVSILKEATFEDALLICQRFVWSSYLDSQARLFWNRSRERQNFSGDSVESLLRLLPDALISTSPIERLELCDICWREDCPASLYCAVCQRQNCPCLLQNVGSGSVSTSFPLNLQGMLWGAPLERVLRICDIEWFAPT